jgi:hypothetical protein
VLQALHNILDRLERIGGATLAFVGTGFAVLTFSFAGAVVCWVLATLVGARTIVRRTQASASSHPAGTESVATRRSPAEDWTRLLAAFTRRGNIMLINSAPTVRYMVNPISDSPGWYQIAFDFSWWGDWQLMCTVVSPSGRTMFHIYQGHRAMQRNHFVGVYPRDFTQVEVARPVEYEFRWARVDSDGYEGDVLWKDFVTVTPEAAVAAANGDGANTTDVRREIVSHSLIPQAKP